MHRTNTSFFGNTNLRDAMDYFIKYVGGSALDAPGFMNLLPAVQWEEGLWYVKGGMHNIADAFEKLLLGQGVEIRRNCEVVSIETRGGKHHRGKDRRWPEHSGGCGGVQHGGDTGLSGASGDGRSLA